MAQLRLPEAARPEEVKNVAAQLTKVNMIMHFLFQFPQSDTHKQANAAHFKLAQQRCCYSVDFGTAAGVSALVLL